MTALERDTYLAEGEDQRRALSSPIRLEILGHFREGDLSVAELAALMGRPASALYYHVGLLEKAGILLRAGERPAGKRQETLYRPVARRIALAADPEAPESIDAALRTAASAFRMAERELAAALRDGETRTGGDDRNFSASRMHCRLTREGLAAIHAHLDAIQEIAAQSGADAPEDAGEYCSFTFALLPLRGRTPTPPRKRSSS